VNRLEETKMKLLPCNSFQDRNSYIERSIIDCMKFFSSEITVNDTEKEIKEKYRKLIKQECAIVKMKMKKEQQDLIAKKKKTLQFSKN
jgi:hypothetical protein